MATLEQTHQPPSAPNSPLAKRSKMDQPTNGTEPSHTKPQLQEAAPIAAAAAASPNAVGTSLPAIPPLQIKKLVPNARTPTRGSAFAAGYDIYSAETATVPARGKAMLSTGIAIAVPPGTYGRVAPRSGLAAKHSLATGAGVIDYDYRGEVKILLFNHSDVDFEIAEGDRMAQLVLERIVTPEIIEVEELEGTVRGAGGFGSTGGFGPLNGTSA